LTKAAEFLEMETLRRPVREGDFPLGFHLRGSGGPVGNLSWIAEGWISSNPASVHPSDGDRNGFAHVFFDCDQERERCQDARVQIALDDV
jgi:hypothetical protein